MGRRPAHRIARPSFGQAEPAVDEGVALGRDIGGEDADLGQLAALPAEPAGHSAGRLALLQESRLVDDQRRVGFGQALERVGARHVAQRIGMPVATAQRRLLAPRSLAPAASARISSRSCAAPAPATHPETRRPTPPCSPARIKVAARASAPRNSGHGDLPKPGSTGRMPLRRNCSGRAVFRSKGTAPNLHGGPFRGQMSFAAFSTASTWPGTLTLRQTWRMTPASSIRKVARSIPMYLRPYMLFSTQVP